MYNYPLLVPLEAFDQFIDSLDLKEVVEIVKVRPPFAERVFQGFRHNAQAVKAPVVRKRLAQAYQTDNDFREMLLEYWAFSYERLRDFVAGFSQQDLSALLPKLAQQAGGINLYLALMLDERKGARKLAEKRKSELLNAKATGEAKSPEEKQNAVSSSEDKNDKSEKLSRELKSFKERNAALTKEKIALEQQVKSLNKTIEKSGKAHARLQSEYDEFKRTHAGDLRRAEHAERSLEQSEKTTEELEHKVKELRKALDAKPDARVHLPSSPWQSAVDDLLRSKKHQPALEFLTSLLPHAQDDPRVHELLNRTYKALGEIENRKKELLWLGDYYLRAGSLGTAADRLCRALIVDPESTGAKSLLRSVLKRIDLKNEGRVSEIRRVLIRFQQTHPGTCKQILSLAKTVSPALARTLEDNSGAIYIDKIYKLSCNGTTLHTSPRQVIEAINRNDTETVASVRQALKTLRIKHPSSYQSFDTGIRDCDASCCVTLSNNTQHSVVDASNVAHNYVSSNGRPRLKNILLLRQELRSKGFFPIEIIADAALPHQIDHNHDLLKMVDSGELELVDPKTDADERIIERAKQLKCPVITLDRMLDWDPENEVKKIRYGIDQDEAEVFDLDW